MQCFPFGLMPISSGTSKLACEYTLLQSISTQASVATAGIWIMVFVDPPIAMQTRIALVIDFSVIMSRGRIFFSHNSMTLRPASLLRLINSPDTAGIVEFPVNDMPIVSVKRIIVFAVPIIPQAPLHGVHT